ncbi:MAG: MarR family transcriptional regulator [Acidimicrobiales bacterium]
MALPETATTSHTDLDTAIAQLQTELNRQDRIIAAQLGIGSAEDVQMLRLLATTGPMRIGQIADVRSAGKATVSARVDRLERDGLVTRARDGVDRRAVTVALTALGESKAEASRSTRLDRLRPLGDAHHTAVVSEIVAALRGADA